jgi:hypothetical protein
MNEITTPAALDAAKLNDAQLDGLACVVCGIDTATPGWRGVPVGMVDGCQVFACAPCVRPAADAQDDGDVPTVVDMAARVRAAAARIGERHGEQAERVALRLFLAQVRGRVGAEEAVVLARAVGRGEWRRVAARLAEVGA